MKKKLRFGTLESKIYIIFTLMIFSTIFLMQMVSSRFTITTVKTAVLENSRVLLHQLSGEIDSYILGMENISTTIENDKHIQSYLNYPEKRTDAELVIIQEKLQTYINAREDISSIIIVAKDNTVISGNPDDIFNASAEIRKKEWYVKAFEKEGETVISSSHVQDVIEGKYPWVVSLSKAIMSAETKGFLGVILVDLKFNRINELCRSLVVGRKGYNFVLDNDANYVFHPTQQLVYSSLRTEPIASIMKLLNGNEDFYEENHKYYMVETSALTGWHVISVTHDSDIIPDWRSVQISYTIIGLVLFLIVGFATNRISSGITKPVRRLRDIMRSVETGEFKLVGSIRGTAEIMELAKEYDTMVGHIRTLMEENVREQELKRKSDLKALQAQINPHFLYNTLDSIIWMGEMKQHEEVVEMTSALSKLFRISISKGKDFITIAEEIAHVEAYMTIQKMRYKDKFKYRIDIDSDLYDCRILKIILQPLVENAIYHGIKEVDYPGFIEITGKREMDFVVLTVSDNGRGMSREELDYLVKRIENKEENSGLSRQGLGVKNVHERIRLYFGSNYGLDISSTPGDGTVIKVRLPLGEKEKEL